VNDYNKLRNLEKLITVVANLSIPENHLNSLLQNILDQLAIYVNTDVAVLGKLYDNQRYEKLFSIGVLADKLDLEQLINKISIANTAHNAVIQVDEVVFVKMDDYAVFAVLNKDVHLKTEKLYLLQLFVQNAAGAIRNAQLYEQLLKKEKLSAIGTAVGMLIHDLRTPVKNIAVITGLMRDAGNVDPMLGLLEKCGEQSAEIFDDFMDFINASPLKKEKVNVSKLLYEGIEMTNEKRSAASLSLQSSIDDDLYIPGDASKLKRIFINLINNAAEALKNAKVKDAVIHVSAKIAGEKIRIVVQDNGPGIPEEIINTLFDAFVTHKKASGTGLGLAIVKQFVLAHNGTISVQNDNGAVFVIYLPVTFAVVQ
jgi:signal transduction histidine kinase